MPLPTIYQLRQNGYKARLTYRRYVRFDNGDHIETFTSFQIKQLQKEGRQLTVLPTGGELFLEITSPQGETIFSSCKCRKNENFNKRIAHNICLGRIFNRNWSHIKLI